MKKERYKARYGTTYEISGTNEESTLSVVTTSTKVLRGKSEKIERYQLYLKSTRDRCLAYMFEIDRFE